MGLIDAIGKTNDKASTISERYVKTSYKYFRLKLFKQFSASVSLVVKMVIIGGLALIGIMLSAMALAIVIGRSLNSYALGFVIVGFSFIVLSIVSYIFKQTLNDLVISRLSKVFFN